MTTSRSDLVIPPPIEAVRLPSSAAAGEELEAAQALERKREEARQWLKSKGIRQPRAVYGAAP